MGEREKYCEVGRYIHTFIREFRKQREEGAASVSKTEQTSTNLFSRGETPLSSLHTLTSQMASKSTTCKSTPLSFFRSFSRKQKKIVNVAVIGGQGVGKSGESVRNPRNPQVFISHHSSLRGQISHPEVHRRLQFQHLLSLPSHRHAGQQSGGRHSLGHTSSQHPGQALLSGPLASTCPVQSAKRCKKAPQHPGHQGAKVQKCTGAPRC